MRLTRAGRYHTTACWPRPQPRPRHDRRPTLIGSADGVPDPAPLPPPEMSLGRTLSSACFSQGSDASVQRELRSCSLPSRSYTSPSDSLLATQGSRRRPTRQADREPGLLVCRRWDTLIQTAARRQRAPARVPVVSGTRTSTQRVRASRGGRFAVTFQGFAFPTCGADGYGSL